MIWRIKEFFSKWKAGMEQKMDMLEAQYQHSMDTYEERYGDPDEVSTLEALRNIYNGGKPNE